MNWTHPPAALAHAGGAACGTGCPGRREAGTTRGEEAELWRVPDVGVVQQRKPGPILSTGRRAQIAARTGSEPPDSNC